MDSLAFYCFEKKLFLKKINSSKMEIVDLTSENIAVEHICCGFSDKKCSIGYENKREWMSQQFNSGYRFKKFNVRGKVFIDYIDAEKAWAPVEAPEYLIINCFWVSGQYKGQGLGKALLNECITDAQDKNGIVAVTSSKKMPFLSDKEFYKRNGFQLADTAIPHFELWYLKLKDDAPLPKFKTICKNGINDDHNGLVVYYSDSCVFTDYYVNVELKKLAAERNIQLRIHKIDTLEKAQNHFVPFTIYSVFFNGKFITHHILSKSTFDKYIKS